jgi:branched-chain amino acid transport system ATP-binding protein
MPDIIEVQHLTKRFGGVVAVEDCTLGVAAGSVTGLIGPNGAGKSTLFDVVAGTFPPDAGRVRFDGEDVTGLPPYDLFRRGLLRTFQIPHEFSRMTALENLMMVPADQHGERLWGAWLRPGAVARGEMSVRARAEEALRFLGLSGVKNELAGNLSGGQKKLLELGRTMLVDARVVLLDEIGAGVNRTLLSDLAANIERLNRERGYTFFVIEHDMDLIGRLCHPVIVMAQGTVMRRGGIEELKSDPAVIEAYFGGDPQAGHGASAERP